MTDYAIPIVWPNYPITTPSGPAIGGLGHAGVVIVNGSTGQTTYFEYGRYGDPLGVVQTRPVSNLTISNGVKFGRKTKLTEHQQNLARQRLLEGDSARAISKDFGVAHTTILRLNL